MCLVKITKKRHVSCQPWKGIIPSLDTYDRFYHYELDQLICPLKTFLFDMFVTSDF